MVLRIDAPECTFEELDEDLIPKRHESLVTKIRVGITKHTTGSGTSKANDKLVSSLNKKRHELSREALPKMLSGLQYVWLIKRFFRIHETKRVQYELSALTGLEYPGDAQLSTWKNNLDHLLLNLVTKLEDKDKFGIITQKLVGSDRLKATFDYFERLREDHEHRTWEWLSDHIDKLIDDDQKKLNTESLVRAASGKEQAPPKKGIPGAPGTRAERRALRQQQLQQQQQQSGTPLPPLLA